MRTGGVLTKGRGVGSAVDEISLKGDACGEGRSSNYPIRELQGSNCVPNV